MRPVPRCDHTIDKYSIGVIAVIKSDVLKVAIHIDVSGCRDACGEKLDLTIPKEQSDVTGGEEYGATDDLLNLCFGSSWVLNIMECWHFIDCERMVGAVLENLDVVAKGLKFFQARHC